MGCRDLKEILSAWLDGEASPEEARLAEAHLEACGACRSVADRMRRVGIATARIEGEAPPDFRENLFARLEREDLLPKRRSIFVYAVRWAALPAAAVLALFLLVPRDADRGVPGPREDSGRIAQEGAAKAEDLPPEDRDIVAHLEVLEDEDPDLAGNADADATDILLPSGKDRG